MEAVLAQTPLGGLLQPGPGAFTGFTVVNGAGNKLDYYLRRTMTYRSTGCAATRDSTAALVLTNNAPADLPPYVTIRADKPTYATKPGDNLLLVSYYATPGAKVEAVTIDGKKAIVAPGTENGLVVFTLPVELPRGQSRTMVVTLSEPARSGPVDVLRQPLATLPSVAVRQQACS